MEIDAGSEFRHGAGGNPVPPPALAKHKRNIVEGGNLLNPRVADSPFTPILNFDPGGYMKAEFDRPFFTSDLDQGIEISSDLDLWVKDGILLSPPVDNGDGTWRFMIRDRETSSTSQRRFMRHVIRKSK